jgi:hypothetical protein
MPSSSSRSSGIIWLMVVGDLAHTTTTTLCSWSSSSSNFDFDLRCGGGRRWWRKWREE